MHKPWVIGFVDDTEHERSAFGDVVGGESSAFAAVTAGSAKELIAKLEAGGRVDLLLFDLYGGLSGSAHQSPLDQRSLAAQTHELRGRIQSLEEAADRDQQLAAVDSVRKGADALSAAVALYYGHGPDVGLKALATARLRYPLVPAAFLARTRTVVDTRSCIEAGALEVLPMPVPQRPVDGDEDSVDLARRGWEDRLDEYAAEFEALIATDVIDAYLRRLEWLLTIHPVERAAHFRESIFHAREMHRSGVKAGLDLEGVRLFWNALTREFRETNGASPALELMRTAGAAIEARYRSGGEGMGGVEVARIG